MREVDLSRFPSINAHGQASHVSSRYSFIPTTRVAGQLKSKGWIPVKASEMRCNNPEKIGFQKHVIRFRRAETPTTLHLDDIFPEIVLTNAHDGGASFILMAGLFRLVCLNGMVVADSTVQSHRIKHVGYTDQAVLEATEQMGDELPKMIDCVGRYQAIELTKDEQGAFAMASLTAKYGDDFKVFNPQVSQIPGERTFSLPALLQPRRPADAEPSLWNTLNVVQEKLMKGNRFEMKDGHRRAVRAITSVSENIRINRALWRLADEMAKLKS
jgi:hypothetical protein